jgi:hypothetical protein
MEKTDGATVIEREYTIEWNYQATDEEFGLW